MARKNINHADAFKIGSFLQTIVSQPKKPGDYVTYSAGWDDDKVGQKFGYSTSSIARLRQSLFGKLSPGSGGTPVSLLWDRLAKLEARVNALEAHKNGAAIEDDDIVPAQDRRAYSL